MRRISVVIPCLNEARIGGGRLAALQGLRAQGEELILVDGGSDDGTVELASGLVDKLVTSPRGRGRQMNAGVRWASGEILWFLHLDSLVPADATVQIRQAVAGGALWGRFDVRLDGQAPMLRVVERLMNLRSYLTGVVTGDQGLFVRRELFERVGGFPEIPLMEDIAISDRLRRIARPSRLRQPLLTSARRWEQDGIYRTILLMWFLRAAYRLGADPAWLARLYYPCATPRPAS